MPGLWKPQDPKLSFRESESYLHPQQMVALMHPLGANIFCFAAAVKILTLKQV